MPVADGEAAHTASCRVLIRGGVDEKTGEVLSAAVVAERAGWCADLVRGMTARLLAERWNAGDVADLASDRDAAGRPLPASAWMAARRLGWATAPPDGVTVNDRIIRMAQEQAGRVLRSAGWRAALTTGILATWPVRPGKRTPEEWDSVRAAIPGGEHLPSSVIKARTRQVQRFHDAEGRLPRDVFDLEPPPAAAGVLLLSACDRQQATLERSGTDPRRALLRLQLPIRPDPRGYRDWTWVTLPIALPPTVPLGAALHLPALRVVGGKTRAELAFTQAVPRARRTGHTVALGVDWGLNTLLSAGAARLHPDGTVTALGSGAQYRAAGVLAKQHRLRRHGERLHAKSSQYERLTGGDRRHPLAAKRAVLDEEDRRVSARRAHLNDALAWSAARWTVDQAISAGATVIYLEDLRSMEARGMGRTLSTRLSQTVRGKITERTRHLAAEAGITVVTAPAAWRRCGTARLPASPPCRDGNGPGAPAAGGRATGTRAPGSGSRHAASLTSTRRSLTAPQTRWRSAPSMTPARRRRSPEGHATTARLPRAARRDQDVTTTSMIPVHRPHRARGAALGAGFHLHAHATPPRWEPDPITFRFAQDH